MPKCHIVGCGAKKSKKFSNLTFHQLPKNNAKRMKWLEIIGVGNILNDSQNIHICSLHFEESCFNRTTACLKLRDEALPSLQLSHGSKKLPGSPKNKISSDDNGESLVTETPLGVAKPKKGVKSLGTKSLQVTSKNHSLKKVLIQETAPSINKARIPMRHVIDIAPTSQKVAPSAVASNKKKLEEKCRRQQKRIKWLQEKLHAGIKEMAALKDSLSNNQKQKDNNDHIVLVPMEEG